MRTLKTFALCGLVLALAASAAQAGEWRVSGSFVAGTGRFGTGHGFHGHGTFYPWRPPLRPFYPSYPAWGCGPTSWVVYHNGNWNAGWSGGYPVSGYWHSSWGNPIYVVHPWPWVSTYTVFTGGAYAQVDPPPGPPRGNGIFMAAVNAPVKAADALDGIRAPMAQPSSATDGANDRLPAPPRQNLEPIRRVFRVGGVDRAETELGKLLRANPSDAEVSCTYAYVLFLREKYATAGWCLRRALVLDPKIVASGAAGISGFHDAKASAAALERLDRHLTLQPDDASARLVKGWVLFLDARTDDARAEFDRLLKSVPDDAQAKVLRDFCPRPEPAPAPEPVAK